jgi:Lecithin:cholesterol acyltransferase
VRFLNLDLVGRGLASAELQDERQLMQLCYFLGGLGGTTLGTAADGSAPLWVDYTRLAFGEIGGLRLAPDGISPGPPDGVQAYASAPLQAYYQVAMQQLGQQLAPYGYQVMPWGYDWRLRVQGSGAALASTIRANATSAAPCSIVGHSLGGLVARAAWASLVGSGDQNLVRRIVTLGSPHYGSYAVVQIWSGGTDLVDQLSAISIFAAGLSMAISPILNAHPWSPPQLMQLMASWPSFYEALPTLGAPDAAQDPYRSDLYTATNWPANRFISQALLDESRDSFAPFLLSANSMPPSWVLTTVAGTGFLTYNSLQSPQALGNNVAMTQAAVGDNSVTESSALLTSSAQWTLHCTHNNLATVLALSGVLAGMILDERAPPSPPPPPSNLPGLYPPTVNGPPLPTPVGTSKICLGACGSVSC